jgi:hypothetical protein
MRLRRGERIPVGPPSLIEDVLLVARFCRDHLNPRGMTLEAQAAERLLAAHETGGLLTALLRQIAAEIEVRLAHGLRREIAQMVGASLQTPPPVDPSDPEATLVSPRHAVGRGRFTQQTP